MPTANSILLSLAHPDDECFAFGGTAAKCSEAGFPVALVMATDGSAGRLGTPPVATPEILPRVRQEELMRSCRVLGIAPVFWLGYPDGKLQAQNADEIVGRIVGAIRQVQPAVVLTFGPEGAGNRHPDHQAICRFTTEAFHAAGDPRRYPDQLDEGLRPHQPNRLYYLTWPLTEGGPIDFPGQPVTTVIDVSAFLERKEFAFRQHRTQFDHLPRFLHFLRWSKGFEYFHRAYPPYREDGVETDLFSASSR